MRDLILERERDLILERERERLDSGERRRRKVVALQPETGGEMKWVSVMCVWWNFLSFSFLFWKQVWSWRERERELNTLRTTTSSSVRLIQHQSHGLRKERSECETVSEWESEWKKKPRKVGRKEERRRPICGFGLYLVGWTLASKVGGREREFLSLKEREENLRER